MVDLERDLGVVLAERIVRQLGEVHDRVEAFEVGGGRCAGGPSGSATARAEMVVGRAEQMAVAVVAGIQTNHFISFSQEDRGQPTPYITLTTRYENSHLSPSILEPWKHSLSIWDVDGLSPSSATRLVRVMCGTKGLTKLIMTICLVADGAVAEAQSTDRVT